MLVVSLFFSIHAFAASPECKYAAYNTANPPKPTDIKVPSAECMNRLQQYSNFLGFGKTAENGCSDWKWAESLLKSYGGQLKGPGVSFDEIPDLDNPLAKPVSKLGKFHLKITEPPEGFKVEITAITGSGARCALTVEIARPGGAPAPPATTAKPAAKKPKARVQSKKKKSAGRS